MKDRALPAMALAILALGALELFQFHLLQALENRLLDRFVRGQAARLAPDPDIVLVDIDGTKEPIRVTYSDGFDGLPVPSPDGTRLAWTSSRGGGREGQIYLAQWNHQHALDALAAAPPKMPTMTAPIGWVMQASRVETSGW